MHRMTRSKPLKICFQVRRNGTPIRQHFLKGGVKAGITFNQSYTEVDACIAAGLDYYLWRMDHYPVWLKAEIVVWHQMKNLINAHVKSAEAAQVERASKKGK